MEPWKEGYSEPEEREISEKPGFFASGKTLGTKPANNFAAARSRDDANGTEANVSRRELKAVGKRPSNFEAQRSAS